MKKTIFDKIVVGFVLLVIAIFSVLALYTVHMTQSRLLNNTEKNLNTESKLIIDTTIHDYLNNTIDQYTGCDHTGSRLCSDLVCIYHRCTCKSDLLWYDYFIEEEIENR